jgi:hypothetical protein
MMERLLLRHGGAYFERKNNGPEQQVDNGSDLSQCRMSRAPGSLSCFVS